MYLRKFMSGDRVSYIGRKFAKELHGKLGVVVARVQGSDYTVTVDFGDDAFVMDERHHLARFKPTKEQEEKTVEIQVQRRKKYDPDEADS